MDHGNFVWCDLSARNTRVLRGFYSRLFGWDYLDDSDYLTAQLSYQSVAGIYTMPAKFQDMGLPCFWMSYIGVDDVGQTVKKARKLGGKVEVGPTSFHYGGNIALIRDPLGAGFTVYSGTEFPARSEAPSHGCMIWNELCVSKATAVTDFYKDLFHWNISPDQNSGQRYQVFNTAGDEISAIEEVPQSIRGRDEFWGVYFGVRNLEAAKSIIKSNGGSILSEDCTSLGSIVLATDPDRAAFFLVEV